MHDRSHGHHTFSHDALSGLAYDWERVGDPGLEPQWPFKVYLPRSTDDVVRAVREAKAAGERLVVRGSGHSSNRLVTTDGGALLLTERLDALVSLDERGLTCTMQPGALLSEVDAQLGRRGLGLKVIGDHADLTAGGFASVGGISPASHRFGLFVDTVTELEYVDWDGSVHRCGRGDDDFRRVLGGTGQHGVITELTVELHRVRKQETVLRNNRVVTRKVDEFLARALELVVRAPVDAWYARGMWVDVGSAGLGQVSVYRETSQRPDKELRARSSGSVQRFLGTATTALPPALASAVKYLGVASLLFPPAYSSAAHVERFTDDVLDAGVGDPTRMLIVLAQAEQFEAVARELLAVCADVRETGAIGAVALYVKPIESAYLSGGSDGVRHCEIALYVGVDPERMTSELLAKLVDRIDDVAIAHGAFRYMHTRTDAGPERRRLLDPNAQYTQGAPWSD